VLNLYKRFRELDKGHKGYISSDELLNVPELSLNPLALVGLPNPFPRVTGVPLGRVDVKLACGYALIEPLFCTGRSEQMRSNVLRVTTPS
jgi:hypothetical protein